MNVITPVAAAEAAAFLRAPEETACRIVQAAQLLLPDLEQGRTVDAHSLRAAMEAAFGASDAEGSWTWKDAYEACEAAQVLFLRKFGGAMRGRAASPSALLAMLEKVAGLLPSHTRRTQESEALQQFSTPIVLGHVASVAAGLAHDDVVLEPSAGTGLLAIFAELAGRASRSTRSPRPVPNSSCDSFQGSPSPVTTPRRSMTICTRAFAPPSF